MERDNEKKGKRVSIKDTFKKVNETSNKFVMHYHSRKGKERNKKAQPKEQMNTGLFYNMYI